MFKHILAPEKIGTAVFLEIQFCWLGWFDPDKVRKLLHIPEDYVVLAVAPIGYPETPGQ